MADPVSLTLAAVGVGATVAGGLTTAAGQKYAGDAKANMLTYQAGVSKINQQIQLQNADYARKVGEVDAQRSGMRTADIVSKTRAAQGASNLDVNSGSSTDIQTSEKAIGQQDQRVIRANAARQAYGFDVEALNAETSSKLQMMGADTSRTSGNIAATGTLISTAGSVASKWYGASSAFGSGNSGNAFMPSQAFMNNEWGY